MHARILGHVSLLRLLVLLLFSGMSGGVVARAAPAVGLATRPAQRPEAQGSVVRRQVIANTELRALPQARNGRSYLLYVALPPSFQEHPERRYPVLYLCDAYWDFNLVNAFFGNLYYDKAVPEYLLVGIGYPDESTGGAAGTDSKGSKGASPPDYERLRRWDLTPVVDPNGSDPDQWGHAAEFLAVLEKDIMPFVETTYRGDANYRVLGGSSLGGLFTLYAMFAKPGLFKAYVAPTPAVGLGNDWLFKFEEEFSRAAGREKLQARLLITAGGAEVPAFLADIKRFHARLVKRRYPKLVYEFRVLDGERHAGTKPESYNRGLRFAFAPLMSAPQK